MPAPTTDHAEPKRTAAPQRPLWRRLVGWSYFAAMLVLFAISVAGFVSQGHFSAPAAALFSSALVVCDALALIGFCAYLCSKPFLVPLVWRVIVGLLILRLAVSSTLLAANLLPWLGTGEQRVAFAGLVSTLFSIPLLVVLWRYGSRSCVVWNRTRSQGTTK